VVGHAEPLPPDLDVSLPGRRHAEHPASRAGDADVQDRAATRMIGALIPPANDGRGVCAGGATVSGTSQLDQVAERRAVWNHQRAQLARERDAESGQGFEGMLPAGAGDSREIRRLD
jgi:hypothetical protein